MTEEQRQRKLAASRAWRAANPDYHKQWFERAKLSGLKARYARAWREANPEKARAADKAHRHRRRARAGHITARDVLETRERDGDFCCYCLLPIATDLEHCTPLARGGTNTADNLVMACHSCNARKGTKTVLEFMNLWPTRPS